MGNGLDRIYIAASRSDARFTRICVASIRTYYPHVSIRLLAGEPLDRSLARELRVYFGVAEQPGLAGHYGWGFVKLEPLFGPAGERFLVLDSDTVMTGAILKVWEMNEAAFLVDDEEQADPDIHRLYYDWRKVRTVDDSARAPVFLFNSGQWFGTAGVLSRDDFSPWIDWSLPRRLKHPAPFMPGEQGVLNYVLNQKALQGLAVERRKIMRWPGHGMDGLTAGAIAAGQAAPVIVHWAGMKRSRLRDMTGGDVLLHFERLYFKQLPMGGLRRLAALVRHFVGELVLRLRLFARRWRF